MNGIIIVDKPRDWTSQDVITKIKHLLRVKKVGHAGTLDPLATGVLVVLVNDATKLSDYLMAERKEYMCEVVLGQATDTEDVMGKVVEAKKVSKLNQVDEVLASLKGVITQVPPMYSSIHHEGRKLYELARQGITVERKPREIEVYDIYRTTDIVYENDIAKFSFIANVSKGTYVRTLCVEIGKRLGYPAYMNALRRTKAGEFTVEQACSLNDIEQGNYKLLDMISAFSGKEIIEVNDDLEHKVKNGMKVLINAKDDLIIFTKNHKLIAIYEKDEKIYKAKRVWM